ncbi:MAG: prepilin-type N-terminal cleavage/methylation domain-containing protein, partial [Oscillospiraceae bacterium]
MNKLMKRDGLNKKGFTLVELIVVIAILGVLMVVLVPQYIQYVEKSRVSVDESYVGEVAHTMELAAAGNEALYGKSVALTFDNNGKWTVTADANNAAAVTAMTTELTSVYPNNDKAVAATPIFKSKLYKTGNTASIAL